MATVKKPRDFKKGKHEVYSFVYDGETYEFEKPFTAGVLMKYRHLDEVNQTFGILEEIAGEKALEVIRTMTLEELAELGADVFGAAPGE